jgi:hypothetical protein
MLLFASLALTSHHHPAEVWKIVAMAVSLLGQ